MRANIPRPQEALVDPKTGLISRTWYRFFANFIGDVGAVEGDSSSAPVSDAARIARIEDVLASIEVQPVLNIGAILAQVPAGEDHSWLPLVDGAEPPSFITDGAGVLITVAYYP